MGTTRSAVDSTFLLASGAKWQVATFRNGKALRLEWFADRSEALEAAGLWSRR